MKRGVSQTHEDAVGDAGSSQITSKQVWCCMLADAPTQHPQFPTAHSILRLKISVLLVSHELNSSYS
jgi:hypothetical protein